MEQKTYVSPKRTFKIKSPVGGFLEFVGGHYSTSDERIIKHLDNLIKNEPQRQLRVKGKDEPPAPGQNLSLRKQQIVEWQQQQLTRNPADSEYSSPAGTKVASSKDIKPAQGTTPRFSAAETKSAADLLRERVAQSAAKSAATPENK